MKNKLNIYLDYCNNNIRTKEYLKLYFIGNNVKDKQTFEIVKKIIADNESKIINDDYGVNLLNKNKTPIDLILREFLIGKKEKNSKGYKIAIMNLKNIFLKKDNLLISEITENTIKQYKGFLEENYKKATVYNYLNHLKILLKFAEEKGYIIKSPFTSKIKNRIPDTEKVFLTENELEIMYKNKFRNINISNAFLFSCSTGLRISDLMSLKWSNIENNKLILIQKKNNVPNIIPLNEDVLKIIEIQKDISENEYIFKLPSHRRALRLLKQWIKNIGISKNVNFHTARHTFATLCLTKGVDIFTVSKILGHKDIRTTMVYAKLIDKVKEEAINKLPVFSRK